MSHNWIFRYVGFILMLLLLVPASVDAQRHSTPESPESPEDMEEVQVTEKLGDQVSADITLYNEEGEQVQVGDYLNNDKPVLLALVYYECPMLCNLILNGLRDGLEELSWTPGDEFEVLTVSIAPDETPELAKDSKKMYLDDIGRPEAADGWHFMTGEEDQIRRLADEVGFGYKWNESTQEYVHSSSLIFLSDEGVVTRYLHGIDYPELALRNALYDAADGNIGSSLDRVILYCYEYDENSNAYIPVAVNIMKVGGVFTIILLGGFLGILWYRERRRQFKSVNTA